MGGELVAASYVNRIGMDFARTELLRREEEGSRVCASQDVPLAPSKDPQLPTLMTQVTG